MRIDPIPYDPTTTALFHPEKRPPIADFSASWDLDPICAELSRLAYFPFELGPEQELELGEILTTRGFTKPKCFNSGETGAQAFMTAIAGKATFVAFRGTQPDKMKDLLADAVFKLDGWPNPGRVHQGFWKAYRSLRHEIASSLDSGGGDLVFTGHSLGAAMATLMAAESYFTAAILVTFGSPRVGDKEFVEHFEGRDVRRYADCTDIVSRIPPSIIYGHVSKMRYIDRLGKIHYPPPDDASIEADRRKARIAYLAKYAWQLWRNVPVRSGADHAPINYVSGLLNRRSES